MNDTSLGGVILGVVSTLGLLLGGVFGKTLLNRWFARERDKLKVAGDVQRETAKAENERRRDRAADNEQRADMAIRLLEERDDELKEARAYLQRQGEAMADVRAQVARLEERTAAQAIQIQALQASVSRWNEDYEKMEAERDAYRDAKHLAENKLTAALLEASMVKRDLAARDQEIERLKGQLSVIVPKLQEGS